MMYWITRVDTIIDMVRCVSIISLVINFMICVLLGLSYGWDEDEVRCCKRVLKYTIPIMIIFTLLYMFIPTKEDLLLIYNIK